MYALKVNKSRIFNYVGDLKQCELLREEITKSDLLENKPTRITEIIELGNKYNGWVNFETWAVFTWLTSYEFTDNGKDIQQLTNAVLNTDYSIYCYTQNEILGVIVVRLERIVFSNKNLWRGLCCDLTDLPFTEYFPENYRVRLYSYFRENSKIVWSDVIDALKECS